MSPRQSHLAVAVAVAVAAPLAGCHNLPITGDNRSPIDAWLVWSTDAGTQRAHTLWVDGNGAVLGKADGVLVVRGESVYRVDTSQSSVPTYDCAQLNALPDADDTAAAPAAAAPDADAAPDAAPEPTGNGTHTGLSLTPLTGGRGIDVIAGITDTGDDRYGDYQHSAQLSAGLGPYLFVTESTYADGCGAHGNVAADAIVFDLDQAKQTALVDDASLGAARERARAQLAEGRDEDDGFYPGDASKLSLVASVPTWTDGRLAMRHMFTMDDCYACGDGEWSSYTSAVRVDDPQLPVAFAALAPIPPAVAAWLSTQPEPRGVSWGHAAKTWAKALR